MTRHRYTYHALDDDACRYTGVKTRVQSSTGDLEARGDGKGAVTANQETTLRTPQFTNTPTTPNAQTVTSPGQYFSNLFSYHVFSRHEKGAIVKALALLVSAVFVGPILHKALPPCLSGSTCTRLVPRVLMGLLTILDHVAESWASILYMSILQS